MRNRVIILFLCLSANVLVQAQSEEVYEDFNMWYQAEIDAKINKDWSSSLKFSSRYDFNASRNRSNFVQLATSYDWFKKSKITAAYRLTFQGDKMRHRVIVQSGYRYRMKPFDLIYRVRAEHDVDNNSFDWISTLRNRLTFRYKRKKHNWQPYISVEPFNEKRRSGWVLSQLRMKAGFGYRMAKNHELDIAFLRQQEFYTSNPNRDYIVSITYNTSLSRKKKKKKKNKVDKINDPRN